MYLSTRLNRLHRIVRSISFSENVDEILFSRGGCFLMSSVTVHEKNSR